VVHFASAIYTFRRGISRNGGTREKQGKPKKCEFEDSHDQSPLALPAGVIPREAFHHSHGLAPLLLRRLGGVPLYSPALQIFRGLFRLTVPDHQERKRIRIVFPDHVPQTLLGLFSIRRCSNSLNRSKYCNAYAAA
jgi:hypothetical protein